VFNLTAASDPLPLIPRRYLVSLGGRPTPVALALSYTHRSRRLDTPNLHRSSSRGSSPPLCPRPFTPDGSRSAFPVCRDPKLCPSPACRHIASHPLIQHSGGLAASCWWYFTLY